MSDHVRATWTPFLYDLQGQTVEVFPTESPFLAELSGVGDATAVGRYTKEMDGNRQVFSGKSVKHTIITSMLPGAGWVTETQTWNVPHLLPSQEIHIVLCDMVVPFSVTVDIERDSFDNSGAVAIAQLAREARIALARNENYTFLGDGTGKLSNIASAAGSPGLTITLNATPSLAPFDVLLPGLVVDIATKATAILQTGGKRRKIVSVNEAAGTVTFDTNAAADGDSGNITFAATDGIYIPGSATTPANAGTQAAQGLEQAAAASGTFETLDKAANAAWQGIDGRGGDATVLALVDQILDGAVRRGRRAGLGTWDFAMGDPAVVDLWKQGKYAAVRFNPQELTLKSGFSGTVYEGADKPFPLLKEPAMVKGGVRMIDKRSFQLYGDQKGPQFLEDDGSMFRRFGRTNAKEADLLDRVQLGVIKCNTIVRLDNLAQAQ